MNDQLSIRELQVLEQAARGLTTKTSSEESHHAVQTIKFHRHNIMRKLQAKTITHAVVIAYRQGKLDLTKLNL